MSPQTRDADERTVGPRSWLAADLEGRTVGFWIAVAVAIAVVVVGFGAWWVWGLGQGMPMDDDMANGMGEMPHTDVRLPAVAGFYDGEQILFVHPSADEIESAADAGEVELEQSDVVVNMPVLTWPGGER